MYPVEPTIFQTSLFEQSWLETDFIMSPDGNKIWDVHHCKETWLASLPFVTNSRNAVDIGCRDGEYGHFLLKKFNHIFCFDYRGRKLFPHNVDLARITHFRCALGEEHTLIKASGGGNINSQKIPQEKWHELQLYTLDEFELPNVDYIKIDVDGFESRVLAGAKNTIEKFKPLLVIEQENNDRAAIEFCIEVLNYEEASWDPSHRNVIMRPKQ